MVAAETHPMELVQVDATGVEEWYCPTCGRRFQMRWPPEYAKMVLEPGDPYAIHTGGKGGLQMGVPELFDAEVYPPADDGSDLWRRFLRDLT
jgi:hypothetical protein